MQLGKKKIKKKSPDLSALFPRLCPACRALTFHPAPRLLHVVQGPAEHREQGASPASACKCSRQILQPLIFSVCCFLHCLPGAEAWQGVFRDKVGRLASLGSKRQTPAGGCCSPWPFLALLCSETSTSAAPGVQSTRGCSLQVSATELPRSLWCEMCKVLGSPDTRDHKTTSGCS